MFRVANELSGLREVRDRLGQNLVKARFDRALFEFEIGSIKV